MSIAQIEQIATQALALQECDVTRCEFYKQSTGECLCRNLKHSEQPKTNFCDSTQNNNCYYKQLHSQQKTFTVEDVKKIQTETLIRLNPDDVRKGQWLFSVFNNLLAEFKKAVE